MILTMFNCHLNFFKTLKFFGAFNIFFLCFALARAEDRPIGRKGPPDGWSVGAGFIHSESPYTGVKDKNFPIPYFTYKKQRLFIRGLNVDYNFYESNHLKASAILDGMLFGSGYEAKDSTTLVGMDERKGSIRAGGGVSGRFNKIQIRGKILKDILGVHGGIDGELGLGYNFPISVLFTDFPFTMIGLSLGYKFYDQKYINYYFGVKPSEALANRSTYTSKRAQSPFLSSFLRMQLSKKWSFMTILKIEWPPSEITNSPIVDKNKLTSLLAFFTFKLP